MLAALHYYCLYCCTISTARGGFPKLKTAVMRTERYEHGCYTLLFCLAYTVFDLTTACLIIAYQVRYVLFICSCWLPGLNERSHTVLYPRHARREIKVCSHEDARLCCATAQLALVHRKTKPEKRKNEKKTPVQSVDQPRYMYALSRLRTPCFRRERGASAHLQTARRKSAATEVIFYRNLCGL